MAYAPQAGDIIADRYRLEKKLGVGAMGSVWRASHLTLGNPVAIKIIREAAARNERSLARFEREAVLAARISSAHVVRIIDHGHHEDLPFIVMDYLEGEDLRHRLDDRAPLPVEEVRRIIGHTCRALAAAHAVDLVHRDIKPDNIFITHGEEPGEERALVLDFGVAKPMDTMIDDLAPTKTGSIVGTPYYLSPEQANGTKDIGPHTDLWSLAVVAFECLTGERPFRGKSVARLIVAITDGDIPRPSVIAPELPPGLDSWFERAFQRDTKRRFGDAREMALAFAAALEAKPVEPAPTTMTSADIANPVCDGSTLVMADPSPLPEFTPPPRDASPSLRGLPHTVPIVDQTFELPSMPVRSIANPPAPALAPASKPANSGRLALLVGVVIAAVGAAVALIALL